VFGHSAVPACRSLEEAALEGFIMRKLIAVAVVSAVVFAFGCSTGYESIDTNLAGGGFSEIRLTPDSWRVVVQGNGFTSRGEAEAILLRRCAELALEQGKRYFVLSDRDAWVNIRRTEHLGVLERPVDIAVVTAVAEQERDAFDAVTIIEQTNEAAGGKLSVAAKKTLELLGHADARRG
jgi:hypothetical protein